MKGEEKEKSISLLIKDHIQKVEDIAKEIDDLHISKQQYKKSVDRNYKFSASPFDDDEFPTTSSLYYYCGTFKSIRDKSEILEK